MASQFPTIEASTTSPRRRRAATFEARYSQSTAPKYEPHPDADHRKSGQSAHHALRNLQAPRDWRSWNDWKHWSNYWRRTPEEMTRQAPRSAFAKENSPLQGLASMGGGLRCLTSSQRGRAGAHPRRARTVLRGGRSFPLFPVRRVAGRYEASAFWLRLTGAESRLARCAAFSFAALRERLPRPLPVFLGHDGTAL